MIDILGWIATAVVVGSFAIQDVRKLRIINMIGSILWIAYGFLKQDNPIIFVNISIIIMHTYWFIKNRK
jgi:Flp pilus assembly protein protease CpaA